MGKGLVGLDDAAESLTIREAAAAADCHPATIRRAIKIGALQARIPRGITPGRSGQMGYRITKAALQAWYMGDKELLDGD